MGVSQNGGTLNHELFDSKRQLNSCNAQSHARRHASLFRATAQTQLLPLPLGISDGVIFDLSSFSMSESWQWRRPRTSSPVWPSMGVCFRLDESSSRNLRTFRSRICRLQICSQAPWSLESKPFGRKMLAGLCSKKPESIYKMSGVPMLKTH